MVFSSTTFLFLFLPLVIILYYNPLVRNRKFKNIFLLLVSLIFYAWGEPVFVFLMLISIVITWSIGLKIHKSKSKMILTIGICYHIVILFIFKYSTFLAGQFGLLFHLNTSRMHISLPIGISFFTFQMMSYLFDIYYQKADAQNNLLYVGLYVSFFPQLIAGPIVRYKDIAVQIENRAESYAKFASGIQRFVYGLSKKVLISDYMAVVADYSFLNVNKMSVMTAWLGAVAYTLQIYFDFSGYSDMAIGLGKMFGFEFNENFNYPYISKSITEFWRRWHISLSSWFRDYVYIPLGGNRVSKARWIWNLFVVWLLTGIWHGANWTFLVWGMIYFIFLLVEKLIHFNQHMGRGTYVYTAVVVILTWVIFRSDNLSVGLAYIGKMFGIRSTTFIDEAFVEEFSECVFVLIVAIFGTTPCMKKMFAKLRDVGYEWIEQIFVLVLFLCSLMQVISATYSPFIYFNF